MELYLWLTTDGKMQAIKEFRRSCRKDIFLIDTRKLFQIIASWTFLKRILIERLTAFETLSIYNVGRYSVKKWSEFT